MIKMILVKMLGFGYGGLFVIWYLAFGAYLG